MTIAARAVMQGIKTEYHTFQHMPEEIRKGLSARGLDVKEAEGEMRFRIMDSYTPQTGLGVVQSAKAAPWTVSMKLSEWSIGDAKIIKADLPESEKRWLHIDDDASILLHYNQEKEFIDYWRTRNIPSARATETAMLHSVLTGIASDSFYRKFESLCDGIIEFKTEDKSGEIEHYVRISAMRGRTSDTRWRRVRILESGEVAVST